MKDIDRFSRNLLEESKRFLEKARAEEKQEGQQAFLHAALVLGFSALEAYINGLADELLVRSDIPLLERGILSEKEVVLEVGKFTLSNKLKIYRLEDRIQFLYHKYQGKPIDPQELWWQSLKNSANLRNQLTHPKSSPIVTITNTENAIKAIIETIDILFQAIYKDKFLLAKKGLTSSLSF